MSQSLNKSYEQLRQELLADAEFNLNFFALTISSCVIASLGLLTNSAAVIIGAMIIAPLMQPLRSLALSALEADLELLRKSLNTVALGTFFAVLISGIIGQIFNVPGSEFTSEILARTQPNLADLGIAVAAGAISGFAKVRPQISDALAGTAIAVALMPPLCVVGIGISQQAWGVSGGAFLLYVTNLLGISFACILIFIWGGYYLDPRKVRRAVSWWVGMISILMIPLFLSFSTLVKRNHLRFTIRNILQNETITVGQQARLIDLDVNWSFWSNQPSIVTLSVEAQEPITPRQVQEVERFLEQRLNQRFKIIFRVDEYREVTADELI